jgi:hypothetical protein
LKIFYIAVAVVGRRGELMSPSQESLEVSPSFQLACQMMVAKGPRRWRIVAYVEQR